MTKTILKRLVASLTVLMLCVLTAVSQAGSEINPTMHILADTSGLDLTEAKITFNTAQRLVTQEFGASLANDSSFYCMIHILRWKNFGTQTPANTNAPSPAKLPAIDLQNWYTYNANEKDNFEGVRIFGSRNVGFLYVHLNVLGSNNVAGGARADLDNQGFTTSNRGRTGRAVDSGVVIQEFQHFNYTWEEKEKLPKLAADAGELLGFLAQSEANARFTEQPIVLFGSSSKSLPLKYRTSDITVKMIQLIDQGASQTDKSQISAQTYDNEGRSRFDISLGVPVTRVKELTFDASDNTVRSRNTDRQHVYAFMNIFIKPIDTKGLRVNSTPHLMVGVPISGKPLDSPFVGLGYGYNKIQVFAGAVFNRERRPSSLNAGAAATQNQLQSDLKSIYKPKFMVGLNFPLKQIINVLSPKK